MKVIIIEPKRKPYFKNIDLSNFENNMNIFASSEIDCFTVDRIYLKNNYELTAYVDDCNSDRPDEEFNFFVRGREYDLPVKGKAIISRAYTYGEDIEYLDTTEEDLKFLEEILYR